jgi:hypothetical protein
MSLHLADIKLPKGVKAVTHGKPNPVLVSVVTTAAEEVAEARRRSAPPLRPPTQGRSRQGWQGWRQAGRPAAKAPRRPPAAKLPPRSNPLSSVADKGPRKRAFFILVGAPALSTTFRP